MLYVINFIKEKGKFEGRKLLIIKSFMGEKEIK